jgi:hypothetical protein
MLMQTLIVDPNYITHEHRGEIVNLLYSQNLRDRKNTLRDTKIFLRDPIKNLRDTIKILRDQTSCQLIGPDLHFKFCDQNLTPAIFRL